MIFGAVPSYIYPPTSPYTFVAMMLSEPRHGPCQIVNVKAAYSYNTVDHERADFLGNLFYV